MTAATARQMPGSSPVSSGAAGAGQPRPTADDAGFAVYVHWPFCAQKCPYCDFNSHVRDKGWDEAAFRAAYLRELAYMAEITGPREVRSVFFGGGTPSLMQPATTAAILEEIARHWHLPPQAEITLEANPGSVEASRFAGYRAAGVNRVSLGVQSLRDEDLARLGRIHTAAEALAAVDVARATFDRVSFDLIYARPGQTPGDWARELGEALALGPSHLSLYQLTIEPDTAYARLHAAGKLRTPDPEIAAEEFEITQEMTAAAGLPAYETSNHARPGEESRHNLVYWRYGEYAGVGPGAHGRLLAAGRPDPSGRPARLATTTGRHPETWAARVATRGHGLAAEEEISRTEAADEMLLMGLRLTEGLSLARLAGIGGVRPAPGAIECLAAEGLIHHDPRLDRIAAIGTGRFVLNDVILRLSASFEPVPPEPGDH